MTFVKCYQKMEQKMRHKVRQKMRQKMGQKMRHKVEQTADAAKCRMKIVHSNSNSYITIYIHFFQIFVIFFWNLSLIYICSR